MSIKLKSKDLHSSSRKRLFNPDGEDSASNRKIVGGSTTNLIRLDNVRYRWAVNVYKTMRGNFWIPQRYDVVEDTVDFLNLNKAEARSFSGILSYLIFLDSIQVANIAQIQSPITAPEVSICLSEQLSQEAMHTESYDYIIKSIVPVDQRAGIYDFWREDAFLRSRCSYIASFYQQYVDKPTLENYLIALVADYILEGIYFYNGFVFFYNLSSRQKMPQTSDIFRAINRDEHTHVWLYQLLLQEIMQIVPYSEEQILTMFRAAVEQEVLWSNSLFRNEIDGITEEATKSYTRYLANVRLKAIGLPSLYDDVENPYRHLESLADTASESNVKANFFESNNSSYNMSGSIGGWDEF